MLKSDERMNEEKAEESGKTRRAASRERLLQVVALESVMGGSEGRLSLPSLPPLQLTRIVVLVPGTLAKRLQAHSATR